MKGYANLTARSSCAAKQPNAAWEEIYIDRYERKL
jgi:hypothetical protein